MIGKGTLSEKRSYFSPVPGKTFGSIVVGPVKKQGIQMIAGVGMPVMAIITRSA
jgi:hypothetical protein